jgi:hypothetical protein
MATAKFIYCQVDDSDLSLNVPLRLYRDALAAHPVGQLDRPSTLIQLAVVHFARFAACQMATSDKDLSDEAIHIATNVVSGLRRSRWYHVVD